MFTTAAAEKEVTPMAQPSATTTPFVAPTSIPVTQGPELRSGVAIVTGFMPAGALIPHNYIIPYHDYLSGKGYQRPAQEARINELVSDLRKRRVDLPTAILLNLRDRKATQALGSGLLNLEILRASTTLTPFHVVDGQHRVKALEKLIQEYGEAWSHFVIPFVCMVGATEEEEMEQFYVVNSRAKSVRTDLALKLLRKISDRDVKMLERLEEKGKGWQVTAEKLTEAMAEHSSVWRGLIRLAAAPKAATTMPSASMVTSLKPLLSHAYFSRLAFDQQLLVLEAFWGGIRELMRPAFDEPKEFVIQKGVGVLAMHTILVDLLEIIRSSGQSVVEPASYADAMAEPLTKLEGDTAEGLPVSGLEFWRVSPQGAAGSYSSSAGRRVLIAKIRQHLPNVEAA